MIKNICIDCNAYLEGFNELFNPETFVTHFHKLKDCWQHHVGKNNKEVSCVYAYAESLSYFVKDSFTDYQPKNNNIEIQSNVIRD